MARDTRYGIRRLVRDWPFTAGAVLILGLAIGANTAIFSIVNAVLLRPQTIARPERLVNVYQNDPAATLSSSSRPPPTNRLRSTPTCSR